MMVGPTPTCWPLGSEGCVPPLLLLLLLLLLLEDWP
jgi:hypothetical protein